MKKTIVFLLNATWGALQTLIGLFAFLWFIRCPHYWYKGGVVTVVNGNWGGISLGAFVFVDEPKRVNPANSNMVNHEYGHCLQSALLGPLYLFVIGIPSLIWARRFNKLQAKRYYLYYSWFYTESWADAWGGIKSIKSVK